MVPLFHVAPPLTVYWAVAPDTFQPWSWSTNTPPCVPGMMVNVLPPSYELQYRPLSPFASIQISPFGPMRIPGSPAPVGWSLSAPGMTRLVKMGEPAAGVDSDTTEAVIV